MNFKKYFITGILTVFPLWVTWFVFTLVFTWLSNAGRPLVNALAQFVAKFSPEFGSYLQESMFLNIFAVAITVFALYFLGFTTSKVLGISILKAIENIINKIPIVQTIYGSTKKLIKALQTNPDKLQRVVLIEFPSDNMKTVGFVTAEIKDENTGEDLAAVYVPTTPNPTSGYLEIVPVNKLVSVNMTMDEAMTFIITGGTVSPDKIKYRNRE